MSTDLFARVRKPCAGPYGCTRRVQTLAYVQRPVCGACRRRLANLKRAPNRVKGRAWREYEDRRDYHRTYYRTRRQAQRAPLSPEVP